MGSVHSLQPGVSVEKPQTVGSSLPSQCRRRKMSAPASLAISARSSLDMMTSLVVRILDDLDAVRLELLLEQQRHLQGHLVLGDAGDDARRAARLDVLHLLGARADGGQREVGGRPVPGVDAHDPAHRPLPRLEALPGLLPARRHGAHELVGRLGRRGERDPVGGADGLEAQKHGDDRHDRDERDEHQAARERGGGGEVLEDGVGSADGQVEGVAPLGTRAGELAGGLGVTVTARH